MKKRLDELKNDKETQERREDLTDKNKDRRTQIAFGVFMFLVALIPFCSQLT
ncbi:MAG: hypothetical protein OEM99_17995 [Gammaproteobacteria bacterium]|nr:hypothetical protein [Gammaproteobacteria bacterium]